MDHQRLAADLRQLAAGHRVEIPVYDFATHTRQATNRASPPPTSCSSRASSPSTGPTSTPSTTCASSSPPTTRLCLERRLARDRVERGRSPASIRAQYQDQVRPMYRRHIQPTARYADLILDGSTPTEEQVEVVLNTL